jgi:hypothetical protein
MNTSENKSIPQKIAKKTLKREVAIASLIFWGVITNHMFWGIAATDIQFYTPIYNPLTAIVWVYVASAFGVDALIKHLERLQ